MPTSSLEKVLACQSLPTLPSVAIELLELTRKPDVTMPAIAKVVKSDMGLSAKVLKTVNSSLFGLTQKCSTIERALAYLGLNTVKSLVLGFSLVDCTRGVKEGAGFSLQAYWKRSIYASSAARSLAEITRVCDPDEAFTAAMFQDMGVMAAYVALGNQYAEVLAGAPPEHDALAAHEVRTLGFAHTSVGAELAKRWRMSDKTVECISRHHDPDRATDPNRPMARIICLGSTAAQALMDDPPGKNVSALIEKAHDWFGLDDIAISPLMEKVAESARELGKLFDKDIGAAPNVSQIMSSANEQLLQHQLAAQRETAELREAQESLVRKTRTDALTGANNRATFDGELARLWAESKSANLPLSVLFCDADKFKSVNDNHGHAAGDAVLRELARRMMTTIGEKGIVCRYGGEEFAVLLPSVGLSDAAILAESLRAAIEKTPFDMKGVEGAPPSLLVTVSVGVSATDLPEGAATSPEQLVQQADGAVYAAKRGGRNKVCIHNPATPASQQPVATNSGPPHTTAVATPTPVAPAGHSSTHHAIPAAATSILLVEDDSLAAGLLQATLRRRAGTIITWVRSRKDAAAFLRRVESGEAQPPSIVICDLGLSDGTGIDVVQMLRGSKSMNATPVFMLSSSEDRQDMAAGIRAGADQFFTKMEVGQQLSKWAAQVFDAAARKAA